MEGESGHDIEREVSPLECVRACPVLSGFWNERELCGVLILVERRIWSRGECQGLTFLFSVSFASLSLQTFSSSRHHHLDKGREIFCSGDLADDAPTTVSE